MSVHRLRDNGRPSQVPLPASFVEAWRGLGINDPGRPVAFRFRRRKRGTEVWLRFEGGLDVNLSVDRGVWPASFSAARAWATEFAADHGFAFLELERT